LDGPAELGLDLLDELTDLAGRGLACSLLDADERILLFAIRNTQMSAAAILSSAASARAYDG